MCTNADMLGHTYISYTYTYVIVQVHLTPDLLAGIYIDICMYVCV